MSEKKKMSKKKKIVLWSVGGGITLLIIAACVALFFVASMIYDGSFNYRCVTPEADILEVSEFEGLKRDRHTFESNNGQKLVGYLYYNTDDSIDEKAVIVFAHGLGGGGQTGYMDVFAYLATRGYYVFAYDATGNDESEGDIIGGLPQGLIDLNYAVDYAQGVEELKNLPFMLMGHSWGALSATNALNYHPEVKAVASLAGWNESMDMIEYRGCQMVGPVAKMLIPFARIYEATKYGDYSYSSSMKGFENSDCKVLVIHSEDDDTIPISYGYGKYEAKYGNNERFTFKKYSDRGHGLFLDNTGNLDMLLMSDITDFFDSALEK